MRAEADSSPANVRTDARADRRKIERKRAGKTGPPTIEKRTVARLSPEETPVHTLDRATRQMRVARLDRLEHHLQQRELAARHSSEPALDRGRHLRRLPDALADATIGAREQGIIG